MWIKWDNPQYHASLNAIDEKKLLHGWWFQIIIGIPALFMTPIDFEPSSPSVFSWAPHVFVTAQRISIMALYIFKWDIDSWLSWEPYT